MMKTDGVQQWFFDEIKKKNEIKFKYRDQQEPGQVVKSAAAYMHVRGFVYLRRAPVDCADERNTRA